MIGVQYARPRNVEAATALLASLGPGASIIAGGQELMPELNYNVFVPSVLVDINGLKELKGIEPGEDALSIGALCAHRDIERDPHVNRHAPLLAHAVAQIGGGWQVRNRGTIGGNIVSMHPLYDTIPALLAMDASLRIARDGAVRDLGVGELLRSTDHGLGSEAILTRIIVPHASRNANWGYYKLKNTHGAYASATAAALVELDESGCLTDIRVVVGSVEALPRDISAALAPLHGAPADRDMLLRVEDIARGCVREPISDQRGDGAYRTAMAGVCARRAVERAIALSKQPEHQAMGGL
ncbi:FAD binding domain-containing protein [Sphingobium sp. YBL2]|uniref:FAD binding domain-containing protein n=1 Tax=Sphingobium sp. (strain YBL2) TaxID=484429 RepID=UPI000695E895|nr:FAD binding domain-containing protein [Sphingobium sp. YBL2]